jgi:hypothetical protein
MHTGVANMNPENKPQKLFTPALLVLIVAVAFFIVNIYDLVRSLIFSTDLLVNFSTYAGYMKEAWWTATFYSSELGGTVGGIMLFLASILALYAAAVYWRRGSASIPKIKGAVIAALVLQAGYYLSHIPTVWLGFIFPSTAGKLWYFEVTPPNEVLYAAGFTSLAMVLVLPPLLFKLAHLISKNAPRQVLVRWSAITSVAFLWVVFWFNFTMQWTGMLTTWSPAEVLGDWLNATGFGLSVFGLLVVSVVGLVALLPTIRSPQNPLNLRLIGATLAGLGGYFAFGLIVYFAAGGYYTRRMAWYELIVPHNPYLWCVALLPIAIPLLLMKRKSLT